MDNDAVCVDDAVCSRNTYIYILQHMFLYTYIVSSLYSLPAQMCLPANSNKIFPFINFSHLNSLMLHLSDSFPICLRLFPSRSTPCWPPRKDSSIRCRITATKTPLTNSSSKWTEEGSAVSRPCPPLSPPVFRLGFSRQPPSPLYCMYVYMTDVQNVQQTRHVNREFVVKRLHTTLSSGRENTNTRIRSPPRAPLSPGFCFHSWGCGRAEHDRRF